MSINPNANSLHRCQLYHVKNQALSILSTVLLDQLIVTPFLGAILAATPPKSHIKCANNPLCLPSKYAPNLTTSHQRHPFTLNSFQHHLLLSFSNSLFPPLFLFRLCSTEKLGLCFVKNEVMSYERDESQSLHNNAYISLPGLHYLFDFIFCLDPDVSDLGQIIYSGPQFLYF